jgi:hypothetical protein
VAKLDKLENSELEERALVSLIIQIELELLYAKGEVA